MSATSPAVLALVPDLFFLSRLRAAVTGHGARVEAVRRPADLATRAAALAPALIVVDMGSAGNDWAAAIRSVRDDPVTAALPIIAFGPHVEVDNQAAARAAGATRVLSNSRFVADLPGLLARYLPGDSTADIPVDRA